MRTAGFAGNPRRLATTILLAVSLVPLLAMKAGLAQDEPPISLSGPDDWTHRHVVFSGARSARAARELRYEPRYQQQRLRHRLLGSDEPGAARGREPFTSPVVRERFPGPGETSALRAARDAATKLKKTRPDRSQPARDWATALPAGAKVGDGMYPAKFSFDVTATPSCTDDYVAFNTGLPAALAVPASRTGTFVGQPADGQTVTIGGALVLTASLTVNTGLSFLVSGDTAANAANLAAAIARSGSSAGVTATSSGAVVSVWAIAGGAAGNAITLQETLGSFAWAGSTLAGGADGKPSIVAYNNLYTEPGGTGFCAGTGPAVLWSYYTGPGAVLTSSVLSLDGTKLAFVSSRPGGAALHILQWKRDAATGTPVAEGTVSDPAVPTLETTDWASCLDGYSCMVTIALRGAPQVTRSAPYYDYSNDAIYVGDDAGKLHMIAPVKSGTPAEVTTNWPVTVGAADTVLSSPVVDFGTGRIFTTDSAQRICAVDPAAIPPAVSCTDAVGGTISSPPMIDGSAGRLFAFSTLNGASVHQYRTSDLAVAPVVASIGPSAQGDPVWSGAFDHAYLDSADGTGKLYVIGKSKVFNDRATLYRISIAAGTMSGAPDASADPSGGLPLVVGGGGGGSPVTSFYNSTTGTDWLFMSVGRRGISPCASNAYGCVMALNLNHAVSWPPPGVTAAYLVPDSSALPSASGIIVDNNASVGTYPQAASIYFTFGANSVSPSALCNGTAGVGCAVKLTQSGLR